MSEIPVGSPPAPPGRHAAPGGWYVDPVDQAQERYWDGWQWSRNTRPREGGGGSGRGLPSLSRTTPAVARGVGPRTADGVPLAGWWWRALAVFLDRLFTSFVVALICLPLFRPMVAVLTDYFERSLEARRTGAPQPPRIDPTTAISTTGATIVVAVTVGVALIYQFVFLRWRSATPGKLITGLRVVPAERGTATERLPWRTIVIRAGVWSLPGLSPYLRIVSLMDVLLPLWHPRRQALHDVAASTQVVRILR